MKDTSLSSVLDYVRSLWVKGQPSKAVSKAISPPIPFILEVSVLRAAEEKQLQQQQSEVAGAAAAGGGSEMKEFFKVAAGRPRLGIQKFRLRSSFDRRPRSRNFWAAAAEEKRFILNRNTLIINFKSFIRILSAPKVFNASQLGLFTSSCKSENEPWLNLSLPTSLEVD